MTTTLILLLLAAVAALLTLAVRKRKAQRQRAFRGVLDAADALENRLRAAREEIEAIVGEDVDDPVRDALREMLRQRLWLRDFGTTASIEQLAVVRTEIDGARTRIDQQLSRIERARAPVAGA